MTWRAWVSRSEQLSWAFRGETRLRKILKTCFLMFWGTLPAPPLSILHCKIVLLKSFFFLFNLKKLELGKSLYSRTPNINTRMRTSGQVARNYWGSAAGDRERGNLCFQLHCSALCWGQEKSGGFGTVRERTHQAWMGAVKAPGQENDMMWLHLGCFGSSI